MADQEKRTTKSARDRPRTSLRPTVDADGIQNNSTRASITKDNKNNKNNKNAKATTVHKETRMSETSNVNSSRDNGRTSYGRNSMPGTDYRGVQSRVVGDNRDDVNNRRAKTGIRRTSAMDNGSALNKTVRERQFRSRRKAVADDDASVVSASHSVSGIQPDSPLNQWAGFQQDINNIDDYSGMFAEHQSVPISSRSSDQFKRIMDDMKTRLADHQRSSMQEQQKQDVMKRSTQNQSGWQISEEDENHLDDQDDGDDEVFGVVAASPLRQAALRGWQIIRRNIQDVAMERKAKASAFNWSFLRQHISNMSDQEKARRDLYEKYIYKPSNWWSEGLVNFPVHILDKSYQQAMKKKLARKGQRLGMGGSQSARAQSARPVRNNISNAGVLTQRQCPGTAVGGVEGQGQGGGGVSLSSRNNRPFTARR